MFKLKSLIRDNVWLAFAVIGLFVVLFTYLIHFSLFSGIEKGKISGKIRSIKPKAEAGLSRGLSLQDYAIVLVENGERIEVRCSAYCKLDAEITVIVYQPIIGKGLNYVYEGT